MCDPYFHSNDEERIDLLAAATFSLVSSLEKNKRCLFRFHAKHSHTGANSESDKINAAALHKITIYTFLKPLFSTSAKSHFQKQV